MDPKGEGMVVNDKDKESVFNKPRDDKPTDSGSSHKKKDGKKRRIKKIVYYDNDESSSSQRDDDKKKKTVNSNFSFDYSRIPSNSNAHLLSIPLGKTTHFGVTKCVVTYSLSIQVFGRSLKTECFLIVLTIPFSLMSKSIKMHMLPLFC
jgi:hypothetical protein